MKESNYWPTKEQDLAIAEQIIDKYMVANDLESLPLYASINGDELDIPLTDPEWVEIIYQHFAKIYGQQMAKPILQRVVCHLFRGESSIH